MKPRNANAYFIPPRAPSAMEQRFNPRRYLNDVRVPTLWQRVLAWLDKPIFGG